MADRVHTSFPLLALALLGMAVFSGCAARQQPVAVETEKGPSYTVKGKTYQLMREVRKGFSQQGVASWYGPGFHGKKTASGETYDMHTLTAAHNVLPLGTVVKVKNLANEKEVVVKINDRGPFVGDRVLDLSLAAAKRLGVVRPGTAPIHLTVLEPGKPPTRNRTVIAAAPADPKPTDAAPNPFFTAAARGLLARIW